MTEPDSSYKLRVMELEDAVRVMRNVRDSAQAASNRNLEEKRGAEAQVKTLRKALAFAASVIRCGEGWSAACDEIIGEALTL